MLRVRTYLDRSGVEGIGLFAAEDISSGRVIWEFAPHVDLVFDADAWHEYMLSCSPEAAAEMRKYSYKEGGRFYLCADNARFLNHSGAPNMINGGSSLVNVAARDIVKGEELLCDYFEYCDTDDYNVTMIRKCASRP